MAYGRLIYTLTEKQILCFARLGKGRKTLEVQVIYFVVSRGANKGSEHGKQRNNIGWWSRVVRKTLTQKIGRI